MNLIFLMLQEIMSAKYYVLKAGRIILDFVTNLIFSIIYSGKPERIRPVSDPLLLEPATSLVKKIIKQQMKCVDVVEAYISRIKEIQPIINAVSEDRFEDALKDAQSVDNLITSRKYSEEELEKRYPFLGIPFTIKENIGVKDMLNTAGLYSSKGTRASEDAKVVALMKNAGGIPLAVTNLPELCMWWETNNKIYGRTLNPYDTRRIVGGSSGGEAAVLAGGGSLIGIGSDIGGSIRLPAFFTGVFGHKTSKLGPMCRYANDLLPMLKVLSGENSTKLTLEEKVNISKLKIYYMENDGGNPLSSPVNSELVNAQKQVLKHFEEKYNIKPIKVNIRKMKLSFAIWSQNMASIPAPSFASIMVQKKGEVNLILELLKWCIGMSDFTLPCILFAIFEKRNRNKVKKENKFIRMANELKKEFESILADDGIFLYPSQPETAIFHNQSIFKFHNPSYTAIFNILGLPVTQCPLGLSSEGLPLGIQVVGGLNKDHLTISVAMELEKAFGGWKNPNLQ
ncbi:fatty-acid amide hydrolase 2-like [Centruroides sculpturatus]|uniref:fatty-acid amide hydrolase 2-like n=1 Tax=Centruroides sculpturatus TaxID=218467 RepID=UPI000C6DBE28|nr:fatty-acid amide hydrolase 2-like [Centruroides sculpturatus]